MASSTTKRVNKLRAFNTEDIVSALSAAFARTVTNPFSLGLFCLIATFILADILNGGVTPLQIVLSLLNREIAAGKLNHFENLLCQGLVRFLKFIIVKEERIIVSLAFLLPYSLKPKTTNAYIAASFVVLAFALPSVHENIFFVIALCFWGFTQLDSRRNRLVVLGVCVILVFLNLELDQLNEIHNKYFPPTTTPAPLGGVSTGGATKGENKGQAKGAN